MDGEEAFVLDLHFSRVVTVFTDVVLQNAFALCEDIGCILQPPAPSWLKPPPAAARECLAGAAQCQLHTCKRASAHKCREILDIFLHVSIHSPRQNPLVGQRQDRRRLHQHIDLREAQPPLRLQGI